VIQSFGHKATQDFYHGLDTRHARAIPTTIQKRALRLLGVLNDAHTLNDIQIYPGTRLERLHGDLDGFYSVRINQQWRLIFQWSTESPCHVRIIDYH